MLKQLAVVAMTVALGAGTALAQTATPTTPAPSAPPAASKSTAAPTAQPGAVTAQPGAAKTATTVDINTATAKDLAKLPGLDEAKADAIVKGRPYKGKDELVQKKIVPETVFAQIKDQITVKQVQ